MNLALEYRVRKLEKLVRENVSMSNFDCDRLANVIETNLKKWGCSVDVADDNAEYGFVNVGIHDKTGKFVTDYDVTADEYNKFVVAHNDKKLNTVSSYNDIGKEIAKHYGKEFA